MTVKASAAQRTGRPIATTNTHVREDVTVDEYGQISHRF